MSWRDEIVYFDAVGSGEPFKRGQTQIRFPPCLDLLVVLVRKSGQFRERFLCQSMRPPKLLQAAQQTREGRAFQAL